MSELNCPMLSGSDNHFEQKLSLMPFSGRDDRLAQCCKSRMVTEVSCLMAHMIVDIKVYVKFIEI